MHFKKAHKKPILPIRIALQLASFVLCLLLIVSLDATLLVEDLQALTSSGGIRTILSYLTASNASMEADLLLPLDQPSNGFVKLSNTTVIGEEETEEGTNEDMLAEDFHLPTEVMTDPDALASFIHEMTTDFLGEDTDVTAAQVQTFVEDSTVMDFVSEKVSSYISDALTGDVTTTFTADEIMQLIEENEDLLEETFQIEITEETKAELYAQVDQAVTEANLDNTIRNSIDEMMHTSIPGTEGAEVGDVLNRIEWFTHVEALVDAIILCVVLTALIMLLNYYNLPRGLGWTAAACMIAALLMCAPLVVIHFLPALIAGVLPQASQLLYVLDGFYLVMAPYHYALAVIGLLLTIASIVWRFFYKKQVAYA